jgi:hypothetical protein
MSGQLAAKDVPDDVQELREQQDQGINEPVGLANPESFSAQEYKCNHQAACQPRGDELGESGCQLPGDAQDCEEGASIQRVFIHFETRSL